MTPPDRFPGDAYDEAERDLGFAGMVAAGVPPESAWQAIRDDLVACPGALALLRQLDPDSLRWARQRWAAHGLPPPWEGL